MKARIVPETVPIVASLRASARRRGPASRSRRAPDWPGDATAPSTIAIAAPAHANPARCGEIRYPAPGRARRDGDPPPAACGAPRGFRSIPPASPTAARMTLPAAPALAAGHGRAALLTPDGELLLLPAESVADRLRGLPPPFVIHAPATFRRLNLRRLPAFDLLELFAFVLPACPAPPTARGLALALDHDPPAPGLEAEAALLPALAATLLRRLAAGRDLALNRDAAGLAAKLGQGGTAWPWAPHVLAALGQPQAAPAADALKVWRRLPEWEEAPPPPPPSSHPVGEAEARTRLAALLGPDAEQRPGQADYAGAAAAAFAAREVRGDPHLVLAEAGTGTGKTLGYIAPASLWAEKNRGAVWISTYTRHLQRQIDQELARLYPDPAERRRRVVVRKGRENYLCLLNLEDAIGGAGGGLGGGLPVALGLIARWVLATARRGSARRRPAGLVSRAVRPRHPAGAGRPARGMHPCRLPALEALLRRAHDPPRPRRRSGGGQPRAGDGAGGLGRARRQPGADPLRVRRGPPPVRRRRRRLRRRIVGGGDRRAAPLAAGRGGRPVARPRPAPPAGRSGRRPGAARDHAGRRLAGRPRAARARLGAAPGRRHSGPGEPGPAARDGAGRGRPGRGPRRQPDRDGAAPVPPPGAGPRGGGGGGRPASRWSATCSPPWPTCRRRPSCWPAPTPAWPGRSPPCATACSPGWTTRPRRWTARHGCASRRSAAPCCAARSSRCGAWQAMLQSLAEAPAEPGIRAEHVLFLRLERRAAGGGFAREADVGLHRHWLDPTVPFAATLAAPAQGLLVTSATLRDTGEADPEDAWHAGRGACGRAASALPGDPRRAAEPVRLCGADPRLRRDRRARAGSPRWPRPIGRCSWPRAAGRWGCSPRSGG